MKVQQCAVNSMKVSLCWNTCRCLYLSVVFITNNNRLLVTMDGHLPILPVDDGTVYRTSQSAADILWFLKVLYKRSFQTEIF